MTAAKILISLKTNKMKKNLLLMALACAWMLSAQEHVLAIYEEGNFAFGEVSWIGDIKAHDTKAGKGFLLGGDGKNGYVRLLLHEFNGAKVFFSFWIAPVNWTPADGKFHIFAHAFAADESGGFNLYRYGNNDPTSDGLGIAYNQVSTQTDPNQVVINFPNDKILWQKNSWHYFVIVSNDEHIAFYLDGELVGMQKISFGFGGAAEFRFGTSWGEADATELTGIRIGSEIPSPEDVAAEYDRVMMRLEEE